MKTFCEDILSILGVRQEGSLFPFLFPMYLNDIEYYFMLNGFDEKDLGILKCSFCCILMILLLCLRQKKGLHRGFLLYNNCDIWNLTVNTSKTKVMIFRIGGNTRKNLFFLY